MKVRQGFVSNSSSTSYIIALKRDYHFSEKEVKKIVENHNKWLDEGDAGIIKKEDVAAELHKALEALCSESYLCDWDGYDEALPAFVYDMVNVLKDKILLTTIEGAADGPTTYVNVLSSAHAEKLAKIVHGEGTQVDMSKFNTEGSQNES